MPYALFRNDCEISGPFIEKSEAWADAMERGLVKAIPSLDEDPPRRILDLKYAIRRVHGKQPSSVERYTMRGSDVPA